MALSFENNPMPDPQQAARKAAQQITAHPAQRRWRMVVFQGYLIAALSIFAILAVAAREAAFFPPDLTITHVLQSMSSPPVTGLMMFVSWFGYPPQTMLVPVFLALVGWFMGFRREGFVLLVTTSVVAALNTLLKLLIQRPRPAAPFVEVLQIATGLSFPSGHVMGYLALFGLLLFFAYILLKPSILRSLLILFCAGMILLVGPSRVYLGNHWPSDVLAAYLIGSLCLTAAIAVYQRGKSRGVIDQQGGETESTSGSSGLLD